VAAPGADRAPRRPGAGRAPLCARPLADRTGLVESPDGLAQGEGPDTSGAGQGRGTRADHHDRCGCADLGHALWVSRIVGENRSKL
jgi:hypothetical protein